jgi:pyruvate dehydrogenase E1 component
VATDANLDAGASIDREPLEAIQRRVLWLATSLVHHANRVRPNPSGVKVGGHQASSASMVSLMTALWFGELRAEDRVSVKPHASPVLHAINHLLGRLGAEHLTTLREFGGIQAYPSRTKDPDPVDYSTGSVGIGAVAPVWSAIAHRYVTDHFGVAEGGRQISLIGDAELDEGAIWEAVVDPNVARLGDVLWVVDLNRQSLDRVVPHIGVTRLKGMFQAAGWHVETAKYGRRLQAIFERPGGEHVRRRIDEMDNEEYQRLLRSDAAQLRERFPGTGTGRADLERVVAELDDDELVLAVRDLGGHDLDELARAYRACAAVEDRPSIVFAYTIKGWSLPIEGHPANHSALLTDAEYRALAERLGEDPDDPWQAFAPDSPEGRVCVAAAERLARPAHGPGPVLEVPPTVGREHRGRASTQQALGRFLSDLYREAPQVARRVVTVSPDVASSTNLGGWINHVGVWSLKAREDWFADDTNTLVHWRESGSGQHIELGIAEVNLVGLIGELGYADLAYGELLLPIGTLYDPFVGRALEPWSYGMYAGGRSILVGTPSGVTLAPEGGAHQSIVTPSLGLEQPGCIAWEPAFGQDFEWTFLHALSELARPDGTSGYFRLSTRPLDQALAGLPADPAALERRRQDVLAGGYRLRDRTGGRGAQPGRRAVTLVGMGAILPEVVAAADELEAEGDLDVNVVVRTSADLVFRAWRSSQGLGSHDPEILDRLLPAGDAGVPIVTVLDGHPHALAFLGGVRGTPTAGLGVDAFGQSGLPGELYAHFSLDPDTIVGAALDLM